MTAKSETVGVVGKDVVAWQMRTIDDPEGFGMWQNCSADNAKLLSDSIYSEQWEVRALVPEAAMAELEESRADWRRIAQSEQRKRQALLSGLEALAGEWEGIVQRCIAQSNAAQNRENFTDFEIVAGSYKDAAERIRALIPAAANTESEEGR